MVKPIKPNEIDEKIIYAIEDQMLQAVNNMIVKNWNGDSATVKQCDIIEEYFKVNGKRRTQKARTELFERKQLNFEQAYRNSGWDVEYDRPGYNETYEPTFTFKPKRG